MAGLQIERVVKRFGAVEVIHGVSIDIEDGEFVVLVGPSGCGKSTLLRMIAGLDAVTSGIIRIGGRIVNNVLPKDRDIAMVFQNYALYPHMTVARNMSFALELSGAARTEIDAKVKRAAEILGLGAFLLRLPRELSGGQRQRVAMGRAIVRDPAVFLFDEPLSNLDAKLRVQMRAEIRGLQQRLASTTVYVTHDQIEAMTMADKIVVLRDGVVEQVGSPLDLYDRPANVFVAGFIGSPAMNLLNGRVATEGEPRFLMESGVEAPLIHVPPSARGREVVLGVRPEHISLGGPRALAARVSVVEPTGAETFVNATLAGQEIVCALRERVTHAPGADMLLSFDAEKVHLFDRQSGAALSD